MNLSNSLQKSDKMLGNPIATWASSCICVRWFMLSTCFVKWCSVPTLRAWMARGGGGLKIALLKHREILRKQISDRSSYKNVQENVLTYQNALIKSNSD